MNNKIFNNIKKLNSGSLNPPRTNTNNINPSNINSKTKKINRQYNKSALNGITRKHNINISTSNKLFIYFKYLCVVRAYADAIEMMGKDEARKHLSSIYSNPVDSIGMFVKKSLDDIFTHNKVRSAAMVIGMYNRIFNFKTSKKPSGESKLTSTNRKGLIRGNFTMENIKKVRKNTERTKRMAIKNARNRQTRLKAFTQRRRPEVMTVG